eukprot:7135818-Prymnesium_polylepis.2
MGVDKATKHLRGAIHLIINRRLPRWSGRSKRGGRAGAQFTDRDGGEGLRRVWRQQCGRVGMVAGRLERRERTMKD